MSSFLPFNRPAVTGREQAYLQEALDRGKFAAGGPFTARASAWLQEHLGAPGVFLTTSCTAALEAAALLCDLQPGDEVILPSFAFSSTATAFARCGARLVFVDVHPDTMNLDVGRVEAAITDSTRAIVAVHYAGVSCEMAALGKIARDHDLFLIEDAAQAIFSSYENRPCGTLSHFGCISFHESKNLHCGEGGALIVNESRFVERAEIVVEKGTDRARFFRGEIDRYTWRDIGSSFVLGELNAAFLLAQLESGAEVTRRRVAAWERYRELLVPMAEEGFFEITQIPVSCRHNAHIFWIKLSSSDQRSGLIAHLREREIHSVFHYVPLHSSPAGRRFGRFHGEDRITSADAGRLLRLPLFHGFDQPERVVKALREFLRRGATSRIPHC